MTAVTGVRAHQTMLDVVGNNVANVNTTGFKKSSTIFQDLLYQTARGATAPGDNRGGINPLQVGLGVSVAGVEMVNTAGPLQYTGNPTDVAIQGDGFFVLSDGMNKLYSRAGNFSLDATGTLVHVGTGFKVQGYEMVQDPVNPMNYIQDGALSDIKLKIGSKMEAKETSLVGFRCNLDSKVGTFLPFGITNMNATARLSPATAGDDPINCTIINNGASGTAVGEFTTYTLRNEETGASFDIVLEIVGIGSDGKPRLAFAGGVSTLPLTGFSLDVVTYDSINGVLRIETTGTPPVVKWNANILTKAEYSSFKLEDVSTGDVYSVLLEFNENSLSGSKAPAVMWIDDGAGNMTRVEVNIPLKVDGTFDIPDNGIKLEDIRVGADNFPAPWGTSGNIIIKAAAQGRGLDIQAVYDASLELRSVSTITQDMNSTHPTKLEIYDCQGIPHTLEVVFNKVGENQWYWVAFFPNEPDLIPEPNSGPIQFGPCGKLIAPPSANIKIPYSITGSKDGAVTLDFSGKSFGYGDAIEGVTQYGSETTTKAYFQDGYAMGVLTDFTVGQNGVINGRYSNSKTIPLYRLALATFDNPTGLERVGNTSFRESANSGLAQIGVPMEGGTGLTLGGNLEMSNVDISEEFTRLILSQRGFQANARIVTVSDSILEELVNLKR